MLGAKQIKSTTVYVFVFFGCLIGLDGLLDAIKYAWIAYFAFSLNFYSVAFLQLPCLSSILRQGHIKSKHERKQS